MESFYFVFEKPCSYKKKQDIGCSFDTGYLAFLASYKALPSLTVADIFEPPYSTVYAKSKSIPQNKKAYRQNKKV